MLTNAYVMKRNIDKHYFGVKERDLIYHHEFRKAIALHWISPEKYLACSNDTTTTEIVPMSTLEFTIASRIKKAGRE